MFSKDGREALGYFIQMFLFTCMNILSLRPKLQGFVMIGGMNIILCYVRKGTMREVVEKVYFCDP